MVRAQGRRKQALGRGGTLGASLERAQCVQSSKGELSGLVARAAAETGSHFTHKEAVLNTFEQVCRD